ncbi:MAG: C40 family peptidase [Pseudomonadota bacterium]
MTFLQPHFRTGQLARSAVLAFSLMATSAWSADAPPPEPNAPMSKLQTLSHRASDLAMEAMGMLGIQYKYGGDTPESGLDCSGLVRLIFKETWGLILPRTSKEISKVGQHIDKDKLQPGDLVFFNTLRRGFSHVGIYLGDRKFIHSPSAGGEVRIESMDIGYWKKRFNGGRRISEPEIDTPQ